MGFADSIQIMTVVGVAVITDFAIGDPPLFPHPVNLIARWIRFFERKIRETINADDNRALRVGGVFLCFSTLAITAGAILVFLSCARLLGGVYVCVAGCAYLLYAGLAARCLAHEGGRVIASLKAGSVDTARRQVAMLVGRDTDSLDEAGIIRASVETVAENTADGVISPLFWMTVGLLAGRLFFSGDPASILIMGTTAMWVFKAVSTLDSIVGYRDERYILLGRASALTDDCFNFIPSRITGAFFVAASGILLNKARHSLRIMIRDHGRHLSPNSGWTEAAASGALGITLGGGAYYRGKWTEKPMIGDEEKPPELADIRKTINMMWICEGMMLILIIVPVLLLV